MITMNVAQFAAELGMPVASLLEQLQSAGVEKRQATEMVSEADKAKLLAHLQKSHGADANKKIALARRKPSKTKPSDNSGRPRTIQVEVRKRPTISPESVAATLRRPVPASPESTAAALIKPFNIADLRVEVRKRLSAPNHLERPYPRTTQNLLDAIEAAANHPERYHPRTIQNVAQFAAEMGVPVASLRELLQSAGVEKRQATETISEADKAKLLAHLQKLHSADVSLISMHIENFTVFRESTFNFAPNLNVIVGENSSGKSHILKLIYSLIATSSKMGRKQNAPLPSKLYLEKEGYADKLSGVFRFESLGRLANRQHGQGRCEVALGFQDSALNTAISFTGKAQTSVQVDQLPTRWDKHIPVYFPTRELLTIYPGFVSMYDNYHLTFEETWYDTCLQLGGLVLKGRQEAQAATLIDPIEAALGGKVILDNNNGRFYLNTLSLGRVEMPLLAEGMRKLAMLARLIATGAIQEKSYLFWDEPEANLNPHLIKLAAEVIYKLSLGGVQVFIATHSLFLLRELEILIASSKTKPSARFFGLHVSDQGVSVEQGNSLDDIGDITALEESLQQSDRYLAMEG